MYDVGGDDGSGGQPARVRIVEFIRAHAGEPWCAECVAARLHLARARAANVFLAIEGYKYFRRADQVCTGCARRRLGLRYDIPPAAPVGGVLCTACGEGIETADELVIEGQVVRHRRCLPSSPGGD